MIRLIICLIVMFAFPSSAQLGIYNGGVPQHLKLQGHSYNNSEDELRVVSDAIGFDIDNSPWFWASAIAGTAHPNINSALVDQCTAATGYPVTFPGCLQGINQAVQVLGACRWPSTTQNGDAFRHNLLDAEAPCLADLSVKISTMPKERICIIDHQINDVSRGAWGQGSGPETAVSQFTSTFLPYMEAALDDILDAYESQGYRCVLTSDTPYMGSQSQSNELRINRNAQLEFYTAWMRDTYLAQEARSRHDFADVWTEFTQIRTNYGDAPFSQLFQNCVAVPPTSCTQGSTCDVTPSCTDGIHPGDGIVSISGSPVSVTFTGKSIRGQIIARAVGVLKQRIRDGD